MKSLVEFIKENLVSEAKSDNKSVTFDFSGIDNADDTVKSLADMENISIDDKKVTVTITADNYETLDTVQDIIQQAVQAERDGTKSSNDEQYAQKVSSLEKKVAELNDAIDSFEDDGDDKKDDNGDRSGNKKDEGEAE